MNERILIEGMMPYRALNRLKREGICLKNVKKCKKTQIVCSVDAKDVEKVFAIYPNMCYNGDRYTAYTIRIMPPARWQKSLLLLKKRVGIWLGCVLFLLLTAYSDRYVLRISVIGDGGYNEAVTGILQQHGVGQFQRYPADDVDLLTAEILRLKGVGFCSIKKVGSTLLVEVRTSPFATE